MAPPPVCQALFLSFQVSLPGSPGAGMTYLRHASLPLAASTATMKSRTPRSPPEAPMTILSFTASGAAVGGVELLLPGIHTPHDPADVARSRVDLVKHGPLVSDVEKTVLGKRRRLEILVHRGAAEGDRIGELEVLDVGAIDLVERRIALRVVGPMVHQPVAGLPVGIHKPFGGDVGGEGRNGSQQDGAGEQSNSVGPLEMGTHGFLLFYFQRCH